MHNQSKVVNCIYIKLAESDVTAFVFLSKISCQKLMRDHLVCWASRIASCVEKPILWQSRKVSRPLLDPALSMVIVEKSAS